MTKLQIKAHAGANDNRYSNQTTTMNKKLLTQKELAAELKISTSCIGALMKEGLPCLFVGKRGRGGRGSRPRYYIDEVEAWMRSRSEAMQKGGEA